MRFRCHRPGSCVIGLLILISASAAIAVDETAALREEIRRVVVANSAGKMRVGVRVERLGSEPVVLFRSRSNELFKPASNQKVITTAAALAILGPDYAYRTVLAMRGSDLVIIGSGDPSIGDPRMARAAGEPITAVFHDWAARLKQRGVTEIKGDLLFDDTIFELEHVHPSWQGRFNLQQWYTAPVGGLNFNDNCVDVLIKPAKAIGQPAVIILIPNTPWTKLANKTKTAKKGEPLISRSGDGPVTVTVSGKVSRPNSVEDPFSLTIDDPGQFFAATCRTVLAAKGIKVHGQTKRQRVRLADGSLPKDVKILAVYERKLKDMLWRCNKSSQNVFAEALFKTVGYHKSNPSSRIGSNKTASAAVLAFLEQLGLNTEGLVIDDGSGLSHENRCTPDAIARVLTLMHYTSMGKVLRSSMATPGEQVGTLRKRLKDLAGKVFAKTGTISGVSALSGYVDGPDGRRYAFCVLCNDTHKAKGGTSAARRVQDALCRKLATWKPNGK